MRIIIRMATKKQAKGKQSLRSLRTDAAAALAADIGWHSRLLARRVTFELDQAIAPSGLTSTQFALMSLIACASDDTLGGLAQRAGLNQSTMSRNVDMLANAGLVEIALVEEDRRRRAVWLTEEGALRLQAAMPLWRAAHRTLSATVGTAVARQVIAAAAAIGPDRSNQIMRG
jgi:DNA-binding MarR family transcriptional regulator